MRIITGRARGLKLNVPKNYDVRPTADRVKESLFNIIGSRIVDVKVLDLFAGTGNLGLEAWSRGASDITFIDISRESLKLVQSNIEKCKAQEACHVLKGNCVDIAVNLYKKGERFDFVFCDPPYSKGWIEKIVDVLQNYPFLNDGGYLIVERSAHDELPVLPKDYTCTRTEKYGETKIDFILYELAKKLEE
ncbi:MAG: 16S rRNA (guanine(966)-N(2))-methyltransferase RsmD [Phascolarctobacterium sp.]|nr:16S rRNA (guanine(966)-N(2))-methyltransferase RsmD [Phascolarctobacterium sp.]